MSKVIINTRPKIKAVRYNKPKSPNTPGPLGFLCEANKQESKKQAFYRTSDVYGVLKFVLIFYVFLQCNIKMY